jgi:hypothetical protein
MQDANLESHARTYRARRAEKLNALATAHSLVDQACLLPHVQPHIHVAATLSQQFQKAGKLKY